MRRMTMMTTEQPEPTWERQDGLDKVPITLNDIVDAITASQSLIVKEVEFNPVVKGDPRIRAEYDKHRAVLERVMEKLVYGSRMAEAKQGPTLIVPGKRNQKFLRSSK
jgi:hypothetical protein